ncbi:hypothetical protein [Methylomonas sp. MgM2]
MFANILRGVLLAFATAVTLLLMGFTVWQFGMVWLATGLYTVAAKAILLAFALLLLLHVGLILQGFYQGVALYFRREAIALRRAAMLQIRQHDLRQRFLLEKRQLHYLSQLKRQRLLFTDDRKHNVELFRAINAEFKCCLEPMNYKTVRKELIHHHKQANTHAMLALRKQVLCQSSSVG